MSWPAEGDLVDGQQSEDWQAYFTSLVLRYLHCQDGHDRIALMRQADERRQSGSGMAAFGRK